MSLFLIRPAWLVYRGRLVIRLLCQGVSTQGHLPSLCCFFSRRSGNKDCRLASDWQIHFRILQRFAGSKYSASSTMSFCVFGLIRQQEILTWPLIFLHIFEFSSETDGCMHFSETLSTESKYSDQHLQSFVLIFRANMSTKMATRSSHHSWNIFDFSSAAAAWFKNMIWRSKYSM